MPKGYFIGLGDRTTCGGVVQQGDGRFKRHGVPHSREGDRVTCGVDGRTYNITGGIPWMRSHGKLLAGTLHSHSTCPCAARLTPSLLTASYSWRDEQAPATSRSNAAPAPGFPAPAISPGQTPAAPENIEEEEEEVEHEQLITLRLGVFFDGTGNNQTNSAMVAGCMASDVGLQDDAEEILRFCAEYGYGVDGSAPDNSYGNDSSNIARLYELYMDQSDETLALEADEAAVKVYVEGIGTVSGGGDDRYAQATGRGKTGVLARVEQCPELILKNLRSFIKNNPEVKISRFEVDIFGFSRGAAAARHFANDLRKGENSLLAKALPAGAAILAEGFTWKTYNDITLNFIGLFDTVPAIVSPLKGDFSPGNHHNSGLELALPTGAARKIVQLVARDEHRLNFSLIRTDNDIVLPGSHSDIGGGYRPRMRERLLVGKPLSSPESSATPNERSIATSRINSTVGHLVNRLVEQGVELQTQRWSVNRLADNDSSKKHAHFYAAAKMEREVDGDLSKVYLRVMRELGVRHSVPFDVIDEQDQRLALPNELLSISAKMLAYATGENASLDLSEAEESLLLRRYIHLSASWNAVNNWNSSEVEVLFINRPADNHKRISYANE